MQRYTLDPSREEVKAANPFSNYEETRPLHSQGGSVRKSIVTVDELREAKRARKSLEKAEGGTYHRRAPKPGGGYRYFYNKDSYDRSKGAHQSGEDVRSSAMGADVTKALTDAGHEGCNHNAMRQLAKKYGRAELADHLKGQAKRGKLVYKGKKFYLGKGK